MILLQQALQEDELNVETVGGELFVANHRGLNLAGLPERFRILEQSLKNKITSQDNKIVSLEDRVNSLTSSLSAYKLLRNRFISTDLPPGPRIGVKGYETKPEGEAAEDQCVPHSPRAVPGEG